MKRLPAAAPAALFALALLACSGDDDEEGGRGAGVASGGEAGAGGNQGFSVGGRSGAGAGGIAGTSALGGNGGQSGATAQAGASGSGGGGSAGAGGAAAGQGSGGGAGAAGSDAAGAGGSVAGAGGLGGDGGSAGSDGGAGGGAAGASGTAGASAGAGGSGGAAGGASGTAGASAGASGNAGASAGESGTAGASGSAGASAGASGSTGTSGAGGSASCADGATQPCFEGAPATRGKGVCVDGVRTCSGGVFGACVGEGTPGPETCNGRDDNCDGVLDEGCPARAGAKLDDLGPWGGSAGPTLDVLFDGGCPGAQAPVGIRMYAFGFMRSMRFLCAGLDVVARGDIAPATHGISWSALGEPSPLFGGDEQGSSNPEGMCPPGKLITGVEGRSGGAFDAMTITCSELRWQQGTNTFTTFAPQTVPILSGDGGSAFPFDGCAPGTVATTAYGNYWSDVNKLGFGCAPLVITLP